MKLDIVFTTSHDGSPVVDAPADYRSADTLVYDNLEGSEWAGTVPIQLGSELRFSSSASAGGPCGDGCQNAAIQVNDLEILEADGTPAVLFDAPEPASWGLLFLSVGAVLWAWARKTGLR